MQQNLYTQFDCHYLLDKRQLMDYSKKKKKKKVKTYSWILSSIKAEGDLFDTVKEKNIRSFNHQHTYVLPIYNDK